MRYVIETNEKYNGKSGFSPCPYDRKIVRCE